MAEKQLSPKEKSEMKTSTGAAKKEEITTGILTPFKAKEEYYEKQMKELEEKLKSMQEGRDKAVSERKVVESELKKLPAVLASGIKRIEEKESQLVVLEKELDELKKGWVDEAKKNNLKEDFINKIIGKRGFKVSTSATEKSTAKPKVTPEQKQDAILKALVEGHDSVTKLYDVVGMSQNTRDNLKALLDAGKVRKDDVSGKYSVV
ncbi:MAG: hypothetical protein EPN25_15425 [Nitrospirae bacterium]|nr:MAG: hypothetical protein EPN25_15425 [Nitrospirota bacterium]